MPNIEHIIETMEVRTLPPGRVREVVMDYLARTQLTQVQLAARIDYSHTALNAFMCERYSGNDVRIRFALTEFIAANPIADATEQLGRLYETENVRAMRRLFESGLRDRVMTYCYGAPGSQKTWVFTHLVAEHRRRHLADAERAAHVSYVYCTANSRPRDLLRKICRSAGIAPGSTILSSIDNLRWNFRQRRALFVLDEAQHLPIGTLEVLREIYDNPPHVSIVLLGSHQLAETFRQRAAELEQWNSRIDAGIRLPGMTEPEAIRIIIDELGRLPVEQVQGILDDSRVPDAYHQGGPQLKGRKVHTYISARRLFKALAGISAHPLFVREAQPAYAEAVYAQGATA